MNAEAEATFRYWIDACSGGHPSSDVETAMQAAMQWAYADAARVCMEFSTVEGIAQKCAEAIEERAR